jgi:hypothetical protein
MPFWFVEITLQHYSKVESSAMKMFNADLVPLNTCRSVWVTITGAGDHPQDPLLPYPVAYVKQVS